MATSLEKEKQLNKQTYPNYKVLMFNDDEHTFDFVIELLCKTVSFMTPTKAESFAWEIHNTGQSIVAVAPFEMAEFYCEVFTDAGMKSSIEPA